MVKLLLKKQLMEVFRHYFYNEKKNQKRSPLGVAMFFCLYAVILVGVLGVMFFMLSDKLCPPLVAAGLGWFFYAILGMIALALGAFGSVFNTYTGLYLSKDNDLLLSMPIPVQSILVARLSGTYLLGLIYSMVVSIPAVIVYIWNVGFSIPTLVGGLLFILIISVVVLVVSCLLGWAVAKLSMKIKHKGSITTILSLVFFGLYYFVFYKAQEVLTMIIQNAASYGKVVREKAWVLYEFGRGAQGEVLALVGVLVSVLLIMVLTYVILSRSYIRLATTPQTIGKVKYNGKQLKTRSVFGAALAKEFKRFTSSSAYMLNCGLGSLMILIFAGAILFKGGTLVEAVIKEGYGNHAFVMMCLLLSAVLGTNDITAPSVSLEGGTIWIAHVLPIPSSYILNAKLLAHILLTAIPGMLAAICLLICWKGTALEAALLILLVPCMTFLYACFGLLLGILRANLKWSNEIVPIKQNISVFIAIFGGWVYCVLWGGIYFLSGWSFGGISYVCLMLVTSLMLGLLLYLWLMKKGTKRFEVL